MSLATASSPMPAGNEFNTALREAVTAVEALFADARRSVAARVTVQGRPMARAFDREQRATHGLAWLATYVEAIRQLAAYTERLQASGNFGETEELLVRIGAGEFLAQMFGGIPMSQGEIVRLADMGLSPSAVATRVTPGGRSSDLDRQYGATPRQAGRADARASGRYRRRLRPR